ncbi:hypothetical protein [Micromonospora sp. NPDC049171]
MTPARVTHPIDAASMPPPRGCHVDTKTARTGCRTFLLWPLGRPTG